MYRVRVRAAQACEDGMKRPLLIIAVFLLAGAVVNVAVAWGCSAWVDVGAAPLLTGWSSSEPPRFLFTFSRDQGQVGLLIRFTTNG